MKKLIICLLTFLPALGLAANASKINDNFSGFNVGLGLGVSNILVDEKVDTTGSGTLIQNDRGKLGLAVKLFAGYNHIFSNRWLFGGDIHYQYNSAKVLSELFNNAFRGRTTVTNMYGLAIHLGFTSAPNLLWYVSAGPELIDYRHKYKINSLRFSNHKTKVTAQFGLGAEQALNPHWHINESVTYTLPRQININDIANSGANVKHKVSIFTAMLSLIYRV